MSAGSGGYGTTGSSTSGSGTQGVTETVQDMTSQAKEQVSELKSNVTSQAKEQATSRVSDQKDRAAQSLNSVAYAVTQVGDQLRVENPAIAQAADTLAEKLQTWSSNLETQDVNELLRSAQRFARSNPTAFLAGAFAVGFLGARFLKSSAPDDRSRSFGGAYGPYSATTRPDYVTGYGTSYGMSGYGAPGAQRAGYGTDYDTTGYGTTPTTTDTAFGSATVGGGIASGAADTTATAGTASRTSYSPYGATSDTGTPTTER
jgi:ElaB/YqjD/DUF883 family membrane-anchored ribosome-binding protein